MRLLLLTKFPTWACRPQATGPSVQETTVKKCEFYTILIISAYIPLQVNAKLAPDELYSLISKQLTEVTAVTVAGDFNHVFLKALLRKFVNFPNGDNRIVDQVYCSIPDAYQGGTRPTP